MQQPGYEQFAACDTAADDVCLIGFTSGTTGEPKGTMHFHRDMLAICDSYAKHVLRAEPSDLFIGSPPLAFTFGLGGLVLFPLRDRRVDRAAGAAPRRTICSAAIAKFGATVCFTAPTAYRAMLAEARRARHHVAAQMRVGRRGAAEGDVRGLAQGDRHQDPRRHRRDRDAAHLHRLAGGRGARRLDRPPVPGYEAKVIDDAGNEMPPGIAGRLAVRGPTGCRYLADTRQRNYVQSGWNVTGDTYVMDEDGYFWYQARSDDMIISSGYNIAGPEVEAALLTHPAVAECGVVGAPDEERGQIVKAYVVLRAGADRRRGA